MNRFISVILLCVASNLAYATCGQDHKRPLDVIADEAQALLYQRDFATLNKLAVAYRKKEAVAADGQPKLMGFYSGLSKSGSPCRRLEETEAQWATHRALLQAWSKASPQSAVPKLALAEFENSYGWKARGGGYASSVSEVGWKLFKERTAKSGVLLGKLKSAAANDPEWYAAMLDTARDQGWSGDKFDAIYRQGVQKFPYYFQYYFLKGQFYSAKWHGSQQEFKAFVEEAVAATEPQLGQTMYARLNWSASQDNMFTDGQTDWPRMKLGFEKMLADFPDVWNRNNFASFACQAGDWQTLKEQLALIGNDVASAAWDRRRFEQCRALAARVPDTNKLPLPSDAVTAGNLTQIRLSAGRDLVMLVPNDWNLQLRQPSPELPPTLEFRSTLNDFAILITPIGPGPAPAGLAELRALAARAAEMALPKAVETELPLVSFQAPGVLGFYFSATDRAPVPGGHRYMTQGVLGLENLRVNFTILVNTPDEAIKTRALKMLETMRNPLRPVV